MQAFFKGYDREAHGARHYLALARTDDEVPLMRHGDLYPYGTRGLRRRVVRQDGDEHGGAARAARATRRFRRATGRTGCAGSTSIPRHSTSLTRFNTLSGQDLSWFWRTWWYETWTLDQAIGRGDGGRRQAAVTIEDRGLAPMPVRLGDHAGGWTRRADASFRSTCGLTGARRNTVSIEARRRSRSIEIDPENVVSGRRSRRTTAGRSRSQTSRLPFLTNTSVRMNDSRAHALTLILAILWVPVLRNPAAGSLMDSVDLPIHETGHLVFSPFGEFMQFLGGTLFQLIMPARLRRLLLAKREDRHCRVGRAVVGRAELLEHLRLRAGRARSGARLVGGGEHDWAYLLGQLGWLKQDQRIATGASGSIGVVIYLVADRRRIASR